MNWECHNCGELHDSVPARCRKCGTAPEIVENVWQCTSCGESGIGGTRTSCPKCGAQKGSDARVVVDASRQLTGDRALALANQVWRYCAYCKTQVPPVNERGVPNERCPTCAGPLSESTESAAREILTAEQAAAPRAQRVDGAPSTPKPHELAPPPKPPEAAWHQPKRGLGGCLYVLAACALLLFMCGYWLYEPPHLETFQVSGHTWKRTIQIEALVPKKEEGWVRQMPAAAYDKQCEKREYAKRQVFDHEVESFVEVEDRSHCVEESSRKTTVDVADGEESYTAQEQDGKSCVRSGFETNGGVAVKKCLEWQPRYKDVTRTRTRYRKEEKITRECVRYGKKRERRTEKIYRQEPIFDEFCHYTVDLWGPGMLLSEQGTNQEARWPELPELGPKQRLGVRTQAYSMLLKRTAESDRKYRTKSGPIACSPEPCTWPLENEAQWRRYPLGTMVETETRNGRIIRLVKGPESAANK